MIIPPTFAQVNLVFTGPAVPRGAQVVYGVLVGSASGATTAPGIAQTVESLYTTHLAPKVSNLMILTEIKVKMGPNATGMDHTRTANVPGQQNAAPDAPQVAVLIRKVTPFGGRTGKGRMFLPGLAEAATNSGGVLAEPDRANLQTNFTAWLNGHDGATMPIQLLHATPGLAPFVVTDLQVQSLVATQRRRLRKVGGRRRVV